MIKHVDLQNPGSFAQPASQPDIGFTWSRLARGVVVYQDECVSQSCDDGPKYFTSMSQRLVDRSSADFNSRAMPIAGIEKNDTQDLLVQKLHISAGFIDRFRVVELLREGVFGFGYGEDAQRSSNSLRLRRGRN